MIDYKVGIDGIDVKSIVDIRFHKGVNEHGTAVFRGIVEDEEADRLFMVKNEVTYVAITIADSENGSPDKPVFAGIISELAVTNERGISEVEVHLIGNSVLLDMRPITRTYQKDEAELSNIVNHIKDSKIISNPKIKINYCTGCDKNSKPKNELLVQYHETDYAFLRRCASLQGLPLITSINSTLSEGVNLNIGLVEGASGEIDAKYYKQRKQMNEFLDAKKSGNDKVTEDDFNVVEVRAREYFDIGSEVRVAGKTLYVYSVDSVYDSSLNQTVSGGNANKDEFWHTYVLAGKKRFCAAPIYNYEMIGASLQATVKEVEKDKIKVDTDADAINDAKAKDNVAFPFATVYSTNDGTGWYCMPEEGDTVRLYLPTEYEDDAYVISAVHLEEKNGLRDKPDTKFIMNKHKKMVEFTKDTITITNNEGMEIKLDDAKGISIVSNKDISLSAQKEVNIVSKKDEVNLCGKTSVTVKQGTSAYIELKGKATVKATSVHI